MTPEQFVYWLQGFMEVANPSTLTETQTQQIKDHLNLVFDKQTPNRSPQTVPVPNTTNPIWCEPHTWEIDPNMFRPIFETTTSTTTKLDPIDLELDAITKRFCGEMEESHNTLFCETHRVPPHMFGNGTPEKKESRRWSNRGNIKC